MQKIHILTGILLSLITTAIGITVYILIFSNYGVIRTISAFEQQGNLSKVISLGSLLNLPLFYLFINKGRYNHAKGILVALICVFFYFLISKF